MSLYLEYNPAAADAAYNDLVFKDKPDLEEVRKILTYLDPNDREQWFKTFAILGREYSGNTDVYHAAQDWAKGASNRKPSDAKKEHHEFYVSSARQGPGIGALINAAKARGYVVSKKSDRAMRAYTAPTNAFFCDHVEICLSPVQAPADGTETTELRLYSDVVDNANTVLKYWLYSAPQSLTAERAAFLTKNKNLFRYFPLGQRGIITALFDYSTTHDSYSYKEFRKWAELSCIDFDQNALNAVLNTESPYGPSITQDLIEQLYRSSHCLMIRQRALRLADEAIAAGFEKTNRAVTRFYEVSQPVVEGEMCPVDEWGFVGSNGCFARADSNPTMDDVVPSGYELLDKYIDGYRRREVTLFAAHSGVGKTWFGVDTSYKLLMARPNARILFVSSEMDVKQIVLRFFAVINDLSLRKDMLQQYVKTNRIAEARATVAKFAESGPDIHLMGIQRGGLSISHIEARVAELSMNKRLDLVVVDYLQNIVNDKVSVHENNYTKVLDTMDRLDQIAKDYNCAVLALTQLNNPNRKQTMKQEPNLYDIAECSYVVQPAAAVLMMYRDPNGVAFYDNGAGMSFPDLNGSTEATNLLLSVAKSRYGICTAKPLEVRRSIGSRFSFVEKK